MAQLSSDRPEPTTILAVTAWRDSKYAATGVAVNYPWTIIVLCLKFDSSMPLHSLGDGLLNLLPPNSHPKSWSRMQAIGVRSRNEGKEHDI